MYKLKDFTINKIHAIKHKLKMRFYENVDFDGAFKRSFLRFRMSLYIKNSSLEFNDEELVRKGKKFFFKIQV